MSDSERSNEPIDHFSEYVRQRLINNPSPPDENCWDEIETRMRRKHRFPLWPIAAIAASIIVAVFILNNTIIEKKQYTSDLVTGSKEIPVKIIVPEQIVTPEDGLPNELSIHSHKDIIANATKKDTKKKMPITSLIEKETNEIKKDDEIATYEMTESENAEINADDIESLKIESLEGQEKNISKTKEDRPSVPIDTDRRQYQNLRDLTAYNSSLNDHPVKNGKWQISAGMGYGGEIGSFLGSLDKSLSENDALSPDESVDGNGSGSGDYNNGEENSNGGEKEKDGEYMSLRSKSLPPKDEITDMTHSIPISAGITIRKKLNKTLGIETGLIYTYLSTDMVMQGDRSYDATLSLHYLGIPVNLIVDMWDNRRWNVYAFGGGMMDKGLQSIYKRHDTQSKEKNSISGLQWSLNGGVGISYNFYKGMNFYVEPGVSYYFENNQPISKRTEDPFNFNLRVGLRYDL